MIFLATFHWGWLLAALLLGFAMGWIAVVQRGHGVSKNLARWLAALVAALLAAALARGKGAIVNVTSIAGRRVHPFAGSAYSTSKAALSALTREMAAEFAKEGVRVNAVAPGEIETAMLSPETETLLPRIPLHRLGVPADVAGTIFFLCSDDAAYVTGTEIFVNGGQHVY